MLEKKVVQIIYQKGYIIRDDIILNRDEKLLAFIEDGKINFFYLIGGDPKLIGDQFDFATDLRKGGVSYTEDKRKLEMAIQDIKDKKSVVDEVLRKYEKYRSDYF